MIGGKRSTIFGYLKFTSEYISINDSCQRGIFLWFLSQMPFLLCNWLILESGEFLSHVSRSTKSGCDIISGFLQLPSDLWGNCIISKNTWEIVSHGYTRMHTDNGNKHSVLEKRKEALKYWFHLCLSVCIRGWKCFGYGLFGLGYVSSRDSSLIKPKVVENEKVLNALIRALQND